MREFDCDIYLNYCYCYCSCELSFISLHFLYFDRSEIYFDFRIRFRPSVIRVILSNLKSQDVLSVSFSKDRLSILQERVIVFP